MKGKYQFWNWVPREPKKPSRSFANQRTDALPVVDLITEARLLEVLIGPGEV